MRNVAYDPHAVTAAYLSAIAPARKVQQEGFRSVERLARFQYAIAGDYLESGLAHLGAAFVATTPAELIAAQSALGRQFGNRLRERARELVEMAGEIQGAIGTATAAALASAKAPKKTS